MLVDRSIQILKKVQFLLKNRGMTIKGVKKILQTNNSNLDENNNRTINSLEIKTKINKISKIIKEIKINGKKNSR